MNYREPQLLDALARQYVIGTMSRRARRRFGRLVDEDELIAATVYALEDDLMSMAWSLAPVEPSELVWAKIARSAGFGARRVDRPESPAVGRWPLAAAALFAAVIVSTYGWWQEWQQPPDRIIETVTEFLPIEPAVGVVADAKGQRQIENRSDTRSAACFVFAARSGIKRPAVD